MKGKLIFILASIIFGMAVSLDLRQVCQSNFLTELQAKGVVVFSEIKHVF